jgi:N-acetylmuramoyl-L-alanine amidase
MSVMFAHRASWHWLVPGVEEPEHGRLVWACTPERRAAWHVRNLTSHPEVNGGKQYVNYWSLGLEIVNRQEGDAFSDWQVEQAGALVRYAWSKYPELREVVSHAKLDPGRRSDPGAHFPWSRFRELVLAPATPAAVTPVRVLGPDGRRIECDARLLDGASVAEIRALVEPLGYSVEYEEGPPLTARITASGKASAKRVAASRRKRARAGGKR